MARVFITGSSDGLGLLAAKALIAAGHHVLLHARNESRGEEALRQVVGAQGVVTADLARMDETMELASKVNGLGRFDAVIHNAGVYQTSAEKIFAVNTLAPYILTCLIDKPERLVYLSSGMHLGGHAKLDSIQADVGRITYSDSKLYVLMLAIAVAERWPSVYSNAVDPGWVPTKMGGQGASDDLQKGYETQVWLAFGDDAGARVSGRYFHHMKVQKHNPEADDAGLRLRFMELCEEITGVTPPSDG
jgi:NAD(P)-dependent dehydrogenase (short-subunit alcohol dehydrogenase family)